MRAASIFLLAAGLVGAQVVPNPTQGRALTPADTGQPMPVFRVTVVSRTIRAINYHHRTGATEVDFRGTELMPAARGRAKVDSRMGSTKIETNFDRMGPATQFGPEYLTYVLWAITPEGRANNLGEVVLDGDHAKLLSTTELQAFGLMVTAEPYFAVTQPSDVVVMENFVRDDTTGTLQWVNAKFELLQRGQYVLNRAAYHPVKIDPKGPLQLAQAENAIQLARMAGADRYAADTMAKAEQDLKNARGFLTGSRDRKRSETNAREATQMAEDARIITIRKIREEQLAAERAAAAKREADARAAAEAAEAQKRAETARATAAEQARLSAEQARSAAEQERLRAEQAKREAEEAAALAAREKAEANAARAAALAQQQQAQAEAERARMAAQQAENEKEQMRQRLLQQLNMILETRDTARGLIVNISDVLFDFDKATLKPGAREKLAKVAGILLAYPGLKIQAEGHTDSIGSDDYNQRLSERRAMSVRDYLVQQSVPANGVTAVGLGKADPVASNDTAAGRQQNRRVELVVSGDVIGTHIGPAETAPAAPVQPPAAPVQR